MSAGTQPASNSKPFCQSVLRVNVPVVVSLANKQLPVQQVLSLVPGSIVQFNKPYNAPMTVEVAEQPIADGEIVKVGEKFGIRINQILPPSERFIRVDTE